MEEEKKEKKEHEHHHTNKKFNLTEKIRENPWILSTIICGILIIVLLITIVSGNITGNVISASRAGEIILGFYESVGIEGLTLESVKEVSGLYEVNLLYKEKIIPIYITKDGKNVIDYMNPIESNEDTQEPSEPILECVEKYNIPSDTIIFYYSNSCGWCTRMKPGVEFLEEQGYNFYWIEASGDDTEVISDCVIGHMTSSGVPQFICVKTGEIHPGAFADKEGNLDQEEMTEWVDSCLAG